MPITEQATLVRVSRSRASIAVLLCAGASALAGCGGSAASHQALSQQSVIVQHPRGTAAQSSPDAGDATAQVSAHTHRALGEQAVKNSRPARSTSVRPARIQSADRVQRARVTPAASNDEKSPTGATSYDPCALVSRSETRAVIGADIGAGVEAPLGPTCVYHVSGAKSSITLGLELLSFDQASRELHQAQRLTVGGRPAYCGQLGQQTLLVSVAPGQVLDVSAPRGVAERLAAIAVSRLTA